LDSDEEVDLEDESSDLGSEGLDLKDEIECVSDHWNVRRSRHKVTGLQEDVRCNFTTGLSCSRLVH